MVGTLHDRLEFTQGRPSGFDYLRITLAVCVVVNHTIAVLHGFAAEKGMWLGFFGPYASFIVPAFFALSGFLVAGSLERNNLTSFLTLRAIRIFPALAVEVLLSALLIGFTVTTLPKLDYLGSPEFHAYFLNVVGYIHYTLPGVFADLPAPRTVNGQLWTVPYELECYVLISVLALLGARKYPRLMFAGLVVFSIGMMARQNLTGHLPGVVGPLGGRLSVLAFLFGVSFYLLRKRIPFNRAVFAVAFVAMVALFLFERRFVWLSCLPVAYVTIYLGLLDPRRIFVIRSADYSYGIYLYGFVVQQTVVYLLPEAYRVWYVHLPLSLLFAGLCAWFSWTFIEAPIMARKKVALAFVTRLTPAWFRNAPELKPQAQSSQ